MFLLSSIAVLSLAPAQSTQLGRLHELFPDDATIEAMASGDFDEDGDADVMIGGGFWHDVALYLNDGAAAFRNGSDQIPTDAGACYAIALGDLDGDGHLDAALANGGHERAWLNDGDATFASVPDAFPETNGTSLSIALGDVNDDGALDALVGNEFTFAYLYTGNGDGSFEPTAEPFPFVGTTETRGVAFVDIDADDDLDIFVGHELGKHLLLNDGTGAFTDASGNLPLIWEETYDLSLGDVDGDDDIDFLVSSCGGIAILYVNNGPAPPTATELGTGCGDTALLADGDGDGDLDAFIGAYFENRYFENDGSGVFTEDPSVFPDHFDTTEAVLAEDFDGDSDVDVIFGNRNGGANRMLFGGPSAAFLDGTVTLPPVFGSPEGGLLADLDGDSDLDCVIGHYAQEDRLLLNDGTGMFVDVSPSGFGAGTTTNTIVAGDVDDDGDNDLFFGTGISQSTAQNRLLLNGGSANFTDVTGSNLPAVTTPTFSAEFGDLDGDGDLDLFVGNGRPTTCFSAEQNFVYINVGSHSGSFVDATPAWLVEDDSMDLAVHDFDDDGYLDVLVANSDCSDGQQNRLYLNDAGSGLIDVTATHLPAVLDFSWSVTIADVDDDGDTDAVFGNLNSENRLVVNDGSGVFAPAPFPLPPHDEITYSVELADFDEDGDPELLIANDSGSARYYENDGAGVFSDASSKLGSVPYGIDRSVLGDVDGDGDIDVWVANSDKSPAILVNHARQIAWRNLPAIGKPLAMEVFGPPLEAWLLVASTGALEVPLPPYGTLAIHPGGVIVVASGVLDGNGRGASNHVIPPDPVLVGFPLHWQGLVGSATPLLTNRDVTAFSDL